MESNPIDIYSFEDLNKVIVSKQINTDIIIREGNITSLGDIEKANGLLGLCDSDLERLGCLKEVKGDFFISMYTVYSNIKTLENLEFVHGDLSLRYSNIEDLGALKMVGGKVNLRDTNIKNLGHLEFVGGDLYLPKKLEKKINLENITINGQVRFWNDSKTKKSIIPKSDIGYTTYNDQIPNWTNGYIYGYNKINFINDAQRNFYNKFKQYFLDGKYIDLLGNDNYSFVLLFDLFENHIYDLVELKKLFSQLVKYYPKTKITGQDLLYKVIEKSGDFEFAWHSLSKKDYISVEKIIEYSYKLNRELLTGELIVKIGGYNHLSIFGQNNIDKIKPFAEIRLEAYKKEKNMIFFDLFVQNGRPIKTKKIIAIVPPKIILSFFQKQTYETVFEYDPDYYKEFFLFQDEYESYKKLDASQIESGYIKDTDSHFPHVVEKSIINQCRLILKQAEDLYRESIGMPKIGEGWISETELFYKISKFFINEEVKQHASPKWLGQQHLDIYFPKRNIGIEYQGTQHYKPIDFFGGQEAFEKTVDRDIRKMNLCEIHNCYLIYVEEGYDINDITEKIENIIRVNFPRSS